MRLTDRYTGRTIHSVCDSTPIDRRLGGYRRFKFGWMVSVLVEHPDTGSLYRDLVPTEDLLVVAP